MISTPSTSVPVTFLRLLRFWTLLGVLFATVPLGFAIHFGFLSYGWLAAISVSGAILLWVLIYSICHWFFDQSLFVRFPRLKRWFRVAIVLRLLIAFSCIGEF